MFVIVITFSPLNKSPNLLLKWWIADSQHVRKNPSAVESSVEQLRSWDLPQASWPSTPCWMEMSPGGKPWWFPITRFAGAGCGHFCWGNPSGHDFLFFGRITLSWKDWEISVFANRMPTDQYRFCHVFAMFFSVSAATAATFEFQRCEWSLRRYARSVLRSGYKASRRCFVEIIHIIYICIHHVYVCTSPFKCLYESYIYNMFRTYIVWFVSDSHVIHIWFFKFLHIFVSNHLRIVGHPMSVFASPWPASLGSELGIEQPVFCSPFESSFRCLWKIPIGFQESHDLHSYSMSWTILWNAMNSNEKYDLLVVTLW